MTRMLLMPPYFFPEIMASTHLDKDRFEAYSISDIYTIVYAPVPTRGVDNDTRERTPIREKMFNDTVEVKRFKLMREGSNPVHRAIRYLISNLKQYRLGIHAQDIDVIYSGSTPPTQGVLCGLVKKAISHKYGRPVPYVYCLQDIFPDSLVNAKMTRKGSLLWQIGRRVEDYSYRCADKIIVISNGFKKNIMAKGVPESKIVVISNWIDLHSIIPISREKNSLIPEYQIDPKKFIVVYAGNFGTIQGATIVLDVAEQLKDYKDIQFVIFGGGALFEDAKKKTRGMANVIIDSLKSEEFISEVYSLGDVSLITCKKGTGNAGLPSKLWSIMACNTQIIAAFDRNSDLADILQESGAGVCVEPENENALKNAILDYYGLWKNGKFPQKDLRRYVLNNAAKETCVSKYVSVLKSVTEGN